MRPYNRQQHWNANVRPPAHQQQQSARHQPPPRQPYYHGGNQQQNRNANMRPPAQRQQQSAQHPPPQQPHHYGDGAAGNVGGVDEVMTLYIASLEDWMDEDYLNSCFGGTEQLMSARIILNKHTGQSEGYGFLEFSSHAAAENILRSFNGKQMPDAKQCYMLTWARPRAKAHPRAKDFQIFVGNLDVSVSDRVLLETFKSEYPSVKSAEVARDTVTGHSKCYGFVKFGDEAEKNRSIIQMHGYRIANRPIRPENAYGKTPSSAQPQNGSCCTSHQNPQGTNDLYNNTRIFVSGLHQEATSEDLKRSFSHFGHVAFAEAQPDKRSGYVQFSDRSTAELVMTRRHRNSIKVLGKTVRLKWWLSTEERQVHLNLDNHEDIENTYFRYASYRHRHRRY